MRACKIKSVSTSKIRLKKGRNRSTASEMLDSMKIFSGTASRDLANEIAGSLQQSLGRCTLQRFSDGEFLVTLHEKRACKIKSVSTSQIRLKKGRNSGTASEKLEDQCVFLIQSTYPPANHLMELLLMANAARNAGAREVVAVIPYLGYSRQDKTPPIGNAWGIQLIADLLGAAGIQRLITCDLHSKSIESIFSIIAIGTNGTLRIS